MYEHLDGVGAVGELHRIEDELAVIHVCNEVLVLGHVLAVQIQIAEVQTGGVLVLHIRKFGIERDLVAVDDGAAVAGEINSAVKSRTRLQQLDFRILGISVVGSVKDLHIVNINAALLMADFLWRDNNRSGVILLADPVAHPDSGDVHKAKHLAGKDLDWALRVGQISLQITPAGPVDAAASTVVPTVFRDFINDTGLVLNRKVQIQRVA